MNFSMNVLLPLTLLGYENEGASMEEGGEEAGLGPGNSWAVPVS